MMNESYQLPSVITHNFDPKRGPFQNICNLSDDDAERILDEIRALNLSNLKPDYLKKRQQTEVWLLKERIKKVGEPRLRCPIYCFLGNFADGLDKTRPQGLVMPLSMFEAEMLTFTYPDSTVSLSLATDEKQKDYRKPYHGHVFTLDEIKAVVAEFGMPDKRGQTAPRIKYDKFIEVQVWDDRPLWQFYQEWLNLHPRS